MVSKLIKLFFQLFEEKFIDVANDTRSYTEKAKDYVYGDDVLLPKGPVGKRIKKLDFTPYYQGSSSSCGAHAAAHARLLQEKQTTFAPIWYRIRSNYNGPGMFLKDVLKLAARADTTKIDSSVKKITESYCNSLPLPELFNNTRDVKFQYTQINPYDVDAVWEAVSNGYPVIVSFYSTKQEWIEEMIPTDVVTLYTAPVRHYVTAIPNSNHVKDGHEWISVVDSSPANGFKLRHVRKDFLKKRMYHGAGFYYPVTTKKTKVTNLPLIPVEYGQRNLNVKTLQEFLVQVGYMNQIHTTGYYGNITAAAVLKWQLANVESLRAYVLIELEGKFWGPQSIKVVKEKYN